MRQHAGRKEGQRHHVGMFKQRMQNVWVTVKESDVLSSHVPYTNKSLSANAVKDAEELLSNINFNSDNEFENKDII